MRACTAWVKGGLAAAAVMWAACAATGAEAADYRLLKLGGQIVKWGSPAMGSGAALTYAFVQERMAFPDAINCRAVQPLTAGQALRALGRERIKAEFRAALDMWEQASNVRFHLVEDPGSADILIGAQARARGIAYANVWHEAGEPDSVARIVRGSICLNPDLPWEAGLDGMEETFDIRQVAAHEIGHVIGLDHPGRTGQLMAFRYDETVAGLRPGDVRGVLRLYGPPEAPQQALIKDPSDAESSRARPAH